MKNKKEVELKAVIFDMDGVIADTMHFHFLANKAIATELGLAFTVADNDRFKGISRRDIIRALVTEAGKVYTEAELEELSVRKNDIYKQHLASMNEADVLDGILPFLTELKSAGIKMAVASSSTNAVTVLRKLQVLDYFEYVVDAATLTHGKPHPEIFLHAADALGVPYECCVAIEDGDAGLQAILQTTMFSVGIGEAPYLKKADFTIPSATGLSLTAIEKRFYTKKRYVIGVDGGGTYTRAVIGDLSGKTIATVRRNGGAHPGKNKDALTNVQQTIRDVVEEAGVALSDVAVVACGIAGLNDEKDLAWASAFTEIDGLDSYNLHVNDAVIAHKGAFDAPGGIIAIAGTGSIVMGVAPDGSIVRNYDFEHLANAGARYLAIDAIHAILSGKANELDAQLVFALCTAFGVENITTLGDTFRARLGSEKTELLKTCGDLAPLITEQAKGGSPVAIKACQRAMANLATGVKLVSSTSDTEIVPVATVGGVLEDPYMLELFTTCLASAERKFIVQPPSGSPLDGAFKLALTQVNLN